MKQGGPSKEEFPIPENFPLSPLLHPFHYFERGLREKSKINKNIENFVNNICPVIPYIENNPETGEIKKRLTQKMSLLFFGLEGSERNKPMTGEFVPEALAQINSLIEKLKQIAHDHLVNNIEQLAINDKSINQALHGIATFEQYLSEEQTRALIETYADLKIKELCCNMTYNVLSENAIPGIALSPEDIEIKRENDEMDIQAKYYNFLGQLSEQVYETPKMQEELAAKLTNDFMSFCHTLEASTDIKIKYGKTFIQNEFKTFVENSYHEFKRVELIKLKLMKYQAILSVLQTRQGKKQSDPSAAHKLSLDIEDVRRHIEGNTKLIKEAKANLNLKTLELFDSIITTPHQAEFSRVCALFDIKDDEITSPETLAQKGWLASMLADSWISNMSNTIYSYIPSTSGMEQGLKTTAKYTVVMAVGAMVTPFGVGAVIAPLALKGAEMGAQKIKEGIASIENTLYGEFTLKYQGEGYKVNDNLHTAFKDKASVVNSFYVQHLFELDIALANMSKLEQKGAQAQNLIKLFQQLTENYQKIRTGSVDSIEHAKAIFRHDIKTLLQQDYQNALTNTAETIVKWRELREHYKEYKTKIAPSERRFALQDASAASPPSSASRKPQPARIRDVPRTSSSTLRIEEVSDGVDAPRASSSTLPIEKVSDEVEEPSTALVLARSPSATLSSTPPAPGEFPLALVPTSSSSQQLVPRSASASAQVVPLEQQRQIAIQEDKLVKLSQDVTACNQRMAGTTERLSHLKKVGSVWREDDISTLQMRDIETYRAVHQNPLDYTIEDCLQKMIHQKDIGYLKWWFKEKCFTVMNKETPEIRRKTVATPIRSLNNKTLWHLLCEDPDGPKILQDIITLQKSAVTAVTAWKFSDYFDPNAEYNGMNPVAYAIQVGNLPMLRAYIENMVTCQASFSPDEQMKCFDNILKSVCRGDHTKENDAKSLCEALKAALEDNQYQKRSYLSLAATKVMTTTSDPAYMEIMSALTMRIAKGEPIPTQPAEIEAFLADIKQPLSSCWHVSGMEGMSLGDTASNISQYIVGRSVLLDYLKDPTPKTAQQLHWGHLLVNAVCTSHPQKALTQDELSVLVAVLKNDNEKLKKLLIKNNSFATMTLNIENIGTINLLYLAAKLGNTKVAGTLFRYRTPVDNCGPDELNPQKNISALVLAARDKHPQVLVTILDERAQGQTAGYQRRRQDSQGKTAFHYLAENSPQDCLRWVQTEADTRIRGAAWKIPEFCNKYDRDENSPLHLLVQFNHLGAIQEIDSWMRHQKYTNGIAAAFTDATNNALTKKNAQGLTPIEIALQNKNPDTFQFLLMLMIETNCIEPVLPDIAKGLKQYGFTLGFIVEDLIEKNKEDYAKHPDLTRYNNCLGTYVRLGVLANDSQSIQLGLAGLLEKYDSFKGKWTYERTTVKTAIEDTLKFVLLNTDIANMQPLILYIIEFVKLQETKLNCPSLIPLLTSLNEKRDDPNMGSKLEILTFALLNQDLIDLKMIANLKIKLPEGSAGVIVLEDEEFEKSENLSPKAAAMTPPSSSKAVTHAFKQARKSEPEKIESPNLESPQTTPTSSPAKGNAPGSNQ